jgi:hypothetical protein
MPLQQVNPAAHALPHSPQFALSEPNDVQTSEQQVSPMFGQQAPLQHILEAQAGIQTPLQQKSSAFGQQMPLQQTHG